MTWQDNENLLIYCSFQSYKLETLDGGGARKSFFEKGGEIWQINALTGESSRKILMEDSLFYCENEEIARIILYNGDLYFSGDSVTYKMRNDSNGFDSILPAIMPKFFANDSCVAWERLNSLISRYNISEQAGESFAVTDFPEAFNFSGEYNILLLRNSIIRYCNNDSIVFLFENDTINEKYIVDKNYLNNSRFEGKVLSIDAMMVDDIVDSEFRKGKMFINIDSLDDIQFKENILGIESPNGLYYAMPGCITDTLGSVVATFSIDNDE